MTEEYKCKDCKWLTGQKNIRGIECMNPALQKKWNGQKSLWMGELRKDTARYKQRNAPACKKFEAKESKPMSRYIDADAIAEQIKDFLLPVSLMLNDIVQRKIEKAPSIDIVRCKECKHNPKGIGWVSCPMTGADTRKPDDFCSYGEREGE